LQLQTERAFSVYQVEAAPGAASTATGADFAAAFLLATALAGAFFSAAFLTAIFLPAALFAGAFFAATASTSVAFADAAADLAAVSTFFAALVA
jgi:hypothetical protein